MSNTKDLFKSAEFKEYINEIKKNIPCKASVKREFIKLFKAQIEDFSNECENLTLENVKDKFGSVQDICQSFQNRDDYMELVCKAHKKNKWLAILIISIIVLLIGIYLVLVAIDSGSGNVIVTPPIVDN